MSSSSEGQDRSRLDGFEVELFKLVQKAATAEQWREWLRAPLEHAAARGNVNLFTRLMDAGADGGAGWRGCHGRTLLGAAASGKSEEMVLALLKAGAKDDLDIMFQDHSGRQTSALHEAVYDGAEEVCQALMLAGADPNVVDGDGNSPLDLAAGAGYVGIVSDLLLKGACLDPKKISTNSSPLHLAAGSGHALCVSRLLLSGADKDSLGNFGSTPLLLAAQNNHLAVVKKLLCAGADTSLADELRGFNPVDIAAKRGNVAVLKFLLESGGGSVSADGEGYTPLHCAAMADGRDGDNSGAIRVLLEAGADVDARTSEGKRPLHYATHGDFESTGPIEALLQEGAEVDARDDTGLTPLHEACCSSDAAAVELLLRWGADETLKHNNGFTVEDFVGHWEGQAVVNEQRRRAEDQRIRRMLARAPADRSWRRRGWLVLCRSRPSRMQLVRGSSSSSSSSSISKPAKGARLSGVPSAGGDEAGDASKRDPATLFGRVIELKAEDVFRLVVCFL